MFSNIDGRCSVEFARAWLKELREPFNNKFWAGQRDWSTSKATIIYEAALAPKDGYQTIELAYAMDCIHPGLSSSLAPFTLPTLRSRLGILGLKLVSNGIIRDFAEDFDMKKKKMTEGGTIIQPVSIINHSGRRLILPQGFGVLKLYYPDAAERLYDDRLKEMLNDPNGIILEGKKGEEWDYAFDKNGRLIGIKLFIDPRSYMFYAPNPDTDENPIQLNEKSLYRESVMKLMTSRADSKLNRYEDALWVCRSIGKLTLQQGINAVVRRYAPADIFPAIHTDAVVLYGGDENGTKRSDWQIYFEFLASMSNLPNSFILEFWKDRETVQH